MVAVPARPGRAIVAVVLASIALASAPGTAAADPSPAQARAKLVKLNERADQLVERYNQATETYKNARKKYDTLNTEYGRTAARAEVLRRDLVKLAVTDYQSGAVTGWQGFVFRGDPGGALSGMASLDHLAQARAARIRAFEAATKELRDRRNAAKRVLAEADTARDKVRDEKGKVDELVDEQTKLMRRLGLFRTGDPNSPGIVYTGPASGNARTALQFAFAQIGKPYQYGGTGPGSYDCSGLTQAAWRQAGVELPRTTWTQWSWGSARRVPLDQLQPGDLLFSKGLGHMGMYAGNGKMVHAPQTGDVIKVVDLDGYWRTRLLGAVRP
ncbi:NlpC/P60 family protein [Nonomuraea jiangxiensis]|uniref:NlpC/P60 family protein n=1 Tax=Nonomuraea jiangxiensis TaxID=633440 RepID=A0A1G9IRW4_9ACTN|nr:C40 family peptidase [Nonomuraea jiangxiensis]SDL27907.1 NlpC/P60 family protein [Nonomuraea jiangxiensis]